jgi:mono/diheme cytochrome c family protein
MTTTHSTGSRPRGGGFALVLWLFAFALMALPFVREPAHAEVPDPLFGRSEEDGAFANAVAEFETSSGLALAQHIAAASEELFGAESQALRDSALIDVARLNLGRDTYTTECIGCHGESGDGAGAAARYLAPRPRNFRKGVFKFTSTEPGGKPLRRDLFRTVTQGLAGSSMPSFPLLSEEKRWSAVEYVRYLALRGEFEELMLSLAVEDEELPDALEIADIVRTRWSETKARIVMPSVPETANDAASVERGRVLFLDAARANCAACHGAEGRGDGASAGAYRDDWGYPIRPRDFTAGVFRSGASNADLWVTISAGIKGTPMGSFGGTLTAEEIWDLVHFVQFASRPNSERR